MFTVDEGVEDMAAAVDSQSHVVAPNPIGFLQVNAVIWGKTSN